MGSTNPVGTWGVLDACLYLGCGGVEVFHPVAPHGYLLHPDLFVCGCRTWICPRHHPLL